MYTWGRCAACPPSSITGGMSERTELPIIRKFSGATPASPMTRR